MWINLLAVSVPLIFSFVRPFRFIHCIPRVLAAFFTVGSVYIIWDAIATRSGAWGFTPGYISPIHLFGLPVEEILFFLLIPYSCLFLYEQMTRFLPDRRFRFPTGLNIALAFVCLTVAGVFFSQTYTRTVFIYCALFFLITIRFDHAMLESTRFWGYIAFTYLPFFVVNYFLTQPPVVWYNPDAIWGIRVTTIPLEDFFYSFSMLGFFTLIYRVVGKPH